MYPKFKMNKMYRPMLFVTPAFYFKSTVTISYKLTFKTLLFVYGLSNYLTAIDINILRAHNIFVLGWVIGIQCFCRTINRPWMLNNVKVKHLHEKICMRCKKYNSILIIRTISFRLHEIYNIRPYIQNP